jgi:hypothetical protein
VSRTPGRAGRECGAACEPGAGNEFGADGKPDADDLRLTTDLGAATGVSPTIAGVDAPVAAGVGRKGVELDGCPTSACATSIAGTATTIPTAALRR